MLPAFHTFSQCNLTRIAYYCNSTDGELYPSDNATSWKHYAVPLSQLKAPTTFFLSLVHFLLCFVIALVLLFCFNSVKVLGKKSYTPSTSSIWWVLFYSLHSCFHLSLMLFLPFNALTSGLPAYCVLTVLHLLTYFSLCGALDHEWRFRTTIISRLTIQPYSLKAKLKNILNYFVNWSRALFLCQTLVLLSIAFIMPFRPDSVLRILLLIYIGSLLLLLCTVLAIGLAVICKSKREARPKLPSKLILAIALVLQITDLFPVFFINGYFLTNSVCLLRFLTPYDLLNIFSLLPLICYLAFIVLEYRRVEAMNKYNIVSDLQALLQFQRQPVD